MSGRDSVGKVQNPINYYRSQVFITFDRMLINVNWILDAQLLLIGITYRFTELYKIYF
jgi:hypothetical protein